MLSTGWCLTVSARGVPELGDSELGSGACPGPAIPPAATRLLADPGQGPLEAGAAGARQLRRGGAGQDHEILQPGGGDGPGQGRQHVGADSPAPGGDEGAGGAQRVRQHGGACGKPLRRAGFGEAQPKELRPQVDHRGGDRRHGQAATEVHSAPAGLAQDDFDQGVGHGVGIPAEGAAGRQGCVGGHARQGAPQLVQDADDDLAGAPLLVHGEEAVPPLDAQGRERRRDHVVPDLRHRVAGYVQAEDQAPAALGVAGGEGVDRFAACGRQHLRAAGDRRWQTQELRRRQRPPALPQELHDRAQVQAAVAARRAHRGDQTPVAPAFERGLAHPHRPGHLPGCQLLVHPGAPCCCTL